MGGFYKSTIVIIYLFAYQLERKYPVSQVLICSIFKIEHIFRLLVICCL